MNAKESILKLLESNQGKYISGQELANSLSISRNAIWKSIHALRAEGYEIDAVTNRGYCLKAQNDFLSEEGIEARLQEFDSDLLYVYDSIDSTNAELKRLAIGGALHGTIVVAGMQTAGTGRAQKSFASPEGGIYFSILFRPEHLENPEYMTAFAAVAARRAIFETTGKQVDIRWTNDLMYQEKKVGGILIEAGHEFESGLLQWMVVGIGINYRSDPNDFSKELRNEVVSLFEAEESCNAIGGKNALIAELIRQLSKKLSITELRKEYASALLYLGERIKVTTQDISYPAIAEGISEEFHLKIRCKDGMMKVLRFGEASVRPYKAFGF